MRFIQKTFTPAAMAFLLVAPCGAFHGGAFPANAQAQRVKASRELAVTVVISPDDEWLQKWDTAQAPHITRLHEMAVEQKLTVGILLSGLRAVKGQIHYRVAVQVLDPKGKAVLDRPDFSAASAKAPAASAFLLVDPTFDFTADNSDPKGVYRFCAVVTDLNQPKNARFTATGEWKVLLK